MYYSHDRVHVAVPVSFNWCEVQSWRHQELQDKRMEFACNKAVRDSFVRWLQDEQNLLVAKP